MYPDDKTRILHILDSCRESVEFLGDLNLENLRRDRKTLQAIIRDIEIIGEAASKLTEEFRKKHNQIPWNDIIGMRNWLAHGYFNVDVEHIWSTVKSDIPDLLSQLEKINLE